MYYTILQKLNEWYTSMKKFQKVLNISSEIISSVDENKSDCDVFINIFFRNNSFIGSNERKIISEIVFNYYRNKIFIDHISDSLNQFLNTDFNLLLDTSHQLILKVNTTCFFLIKYNASNTNLNNFSALCNKYFREYTIFEAVKTIFDENCGINLTPFVFTHLENEIERIFNSDMSESEQLIDNISLKYSFSKQILAYLHSNKFEPRSYENLIALADSSTNSADMIIRVNNPERNMKIVLDYLSNNNIEFVKCKVSPAAIAIKNRINLNILEIYQNGTVEIQDEGSQLISYALSPKPHSIILDACAGAGGKTLHLADLTHNTSRITAVDIQRDKLYKIRPRALKAKLTNIRLLTIEPFEKKPKIYQSSFDYVLVDAPCSGLGTFRRKPQKKYELTLRDFNRYAATELKVLKYFSQFVKPGGLMLYATCTIMPIENQAVVEEFLRHHPDFRPHPLLRKFKEHNIDIQNLEKNMNSFTLSPEIHGTDGYFLALFKKNN